MAPLETCRKWNFQSGLLVLAGIWLLAVAPLFSQPFEAPSKRDLSAGRLQKPPQFDGLVDEPLWKRLEIATDFVQQNPEEGEPSAERTEVRIGFDDQNLYIGIICFDSQPENIVVTQNRRDADLDETDSIQILLDTFNDGQNAFLFGTSPTGIEVDGQVSKAGQSRGGGGPVRAGQGGAQRGGSSAVNLNWDGVWSVRSQVTERGWESEIVIPFRTLRYYPGRTVWGLNVMRTLRRRNERSFWSPVSRAFRFTEVSVFGSLSGLEMPSHHNLQLLPYMLGSFSHDSLRAEDQSRVEADVGLDLKYSLTPNLTLDATVNTDFAQVEVDDEQVNLTRFDLFFPEKRPFFLENSGFFEFGSPREVEIFFSRRIGLDEEANAVPIDAGVRLSGKVGAYQLGFLNMQTRAVDHSAPANNYNVVRLNRELPRRSSIGVISVSRQATTDFKDAPDYNHTFGADANIGFGQYSNWFNFAAATRTPGLEGSDHAYASRFEYDDSRHEFSLGYLEVGENFNPEVGFARRVGFRKPNYFYRFTHYPSRSRVRSIEPHFSGQHWYTLATNERESGFEHYHVTGRFQDGGQLGLAWNRNFERLDDPFEVHPGIFIPEGRYQFSELISTVETDPSVPVHFKGIAALGSFYDGTIRSLDLHGGYRHGRNLTWTANWKGNYINLPVGDFNAHLIGLRFNWSFTPKSFLQTFSQYNSVSRKVGHNIRIGVLSTSSTGLFIVFNTISSTGSFHDPHEVERRTISRALFMKYTHLFDF